MSAMIVGFGCVWLCHYGPITGLLQARGACALRANRPFFIFLGRRYFVFGSMRTSHSSKRRKLVLFASPPHEAAAATGASAGDCF